MGTPEFMTNQDFERIRQFIYDRMGINIDERKRETVRSKLYKLCNRRKITTAAEYIKLVTSTKDSRVLQEFFDAISTNTTDFFREISHFDYLTREMPQILRDIPRIRRNGEIRVWSAAASSGEEAVTIAMVLREALGPGIRIRVLGTDISEKVLRKASAGLYTAAECKDIPAELLKKYFQQENGGYRVGPDIRACTTYRLFNLMEPYFFQHGFDIIFCRNVMIYFDADVQKQLLDKFYDQLVPNGLLMVGHSESLFNREHKFQFVQTAIYKKEPVILE